MARARGPRGETRLALSAGFWRVVLACGVGAFLATGCRRAEPPADLVIINGPEPESLDPHLVTGQADGRIALALFEGLTRYDPQSGQATPGLAERWEITPDGRIYTFHLRANAAWGPGDPITTDDVVWSWRRALEPATACEYAGVLFYLQNGEAYATGRLKDFSQVGVRAVDARTLRVELEAPTAFFLELSAYQPFVVAPRRMIERYGDRWLHARPFQASGAYTLESWRLNDRIRLHKNPHYWDAANTQSGVIDLVSCVSATTALNLYQSGGADVIWDKELVPPELVDALSGRADFHTFDSLGVYFYRYNVTKRPFADARVRRALAMVVDKEFLVRRLTKGGERVAGALTPPGLTNGAARYEPPSGLPYDPGAARRLLAEAGYPEGRGFPAFTYTFNSQESHQKLAVALREMWRRELGVEAQLKQLEWKTYFRAQAMLDYELIRSSWVGDYNDPNTFLDLFLSDNPNNRTGWRNASYDQALRRANAETAPARRFELLRAAETILVAEDPPVAPLFFYVGMEFYDSQSIAGIYPNLRAEHPLRAIRRLRVADRAPRR